MKNFADRLTAAMQEKKSQLCVGLDPRVSDMPPELLERYRAMTPEGCGCGRHEVATCFEEFCGNIIEHIAPHAAAVKIQLACFEQYGPPGMKAFKHSCDRAANSGLIVIADAKRGDIDVSAAAYSAAYLGTADGLRGPVRPFKIDALTVNPLFGSDGIRPFLDDCDRHGKGIFVLVKTSNAGAAELQELKLADGSLLYERVAGLAAGWGERLIGTSGYSSVGAVAGATDPASLARVRQLLPHAILLVPGVGAQGAEPAEAAAAFDKNGMGALITASRSIIYAGKDAGYGAAAAQAAKQMKEALWSASH